MRFLIKFKLFETVTKSEDVKRVRPGFAKQLELIQKSGKLVEGGMFADSRGGFFLVDVDAAMDIYELLGSAIFDNCQVESHPILSFEELGEFFKKHPVE